MSDWRFRSTFYAVGRDLRHDPRGWQEVIASPDTDFSEDQSAVLILHDDHTQCSLVVEWFLVGFGLSWEIQQKSDPAHSHAVVPCIDPTQMHVFEQTVHDDPVPVGSLVDAETAGLLVRAFLEQPDEIPTLVMWQARHDIDWPEHA